MAIQEGRWTDEARIAAGSELRSCLVCGTQFWVSRAQRKVKGGGTFCSMPCKRKGSTAHKKRRGPLVTKHPSGYLLEWAPGHPRASRSRVYQHILIAEAMLGRPLAANEEVHHRNERRDDNWPDNLEVVRKGEHQRLHWEKNPEWRARRAARNRANPRPHDPATGRWMKG